MKNLKEVKTLIKIYLVIWFISILLFYLAKPIDAMGYSIIVFYTILPIITIVLSFFTYISYYSIKIKYLIPILMGLLFMFADYLTFVLANMIEFNTFKLPELSVFLGGLIVSLTGYAIGYIYKKIKDK